MFSALLEKHYVQKEKYSIITSQLISLNKLCYTIITLKKSLDFKKRKGDIMNLAKISSNGQITIPMEIRKLLDLKSGDKVLFLQNKDGEIIITNASAQAIYKAQSVFADAAKELDLKDEYDVQKLVDEVRYDK